MDVAPEEGRERQELMDTVSALAATLPGDQQATIRPTFRGAGDAGGTARAQLAQLQRLGADGLGRRLELLQTLGQGGMGHVRLARQRTMGREVAVKTPRDEACDEQTALKLLREAWITGSLEHPNVVPVYDIGLDQRGNPMILLKRIEGVHWGDAMRDPACAGARHQSADPLASGLRVLLQVCDAVAYAHSRGIVHRDLKPENVMLGEFGEVYVVDWGIAVSLGDDRGGRLPLAREATEVAGTPCYMAPEMLKGQGVDARTDVYLLGATLYELLCGRPPHLAQSLRQALFSVMTFSPAFPADAPAELCAVCARAMAADPAARHPRVEDLRLDLQRFLDHRGSARLAEEAQRRLGDLERALGGAAAGAAPDRLELYRIYSECSFGFREARKTWPDNAVAAEGARRATEAMVAYEVAQGDPRAAEALLAELGAPAPALEQQVAALRRRDSARRQELEVMARVGRQMDPNVGRRTRFFLAAVIGVLWSLFPLIGLLFLGGLAGLTYGGLVCTDVLFMALAGALGLWARGSLSRTAINRRLAYTVGFMLLAELVLHLSCWHLGLPLVQGTVLQFFLWLVIAVMVTITLEWRLLPTSLVAGVVFAAALLWQEHLLLLMCAFCVALTANMLVVWGRPRRADEEGPLDCLDPGRVPPEEPAPRP